jgi:hypothetical protein
MQQKLQDIVSQAQTLINSVTELASLDDIRVQQKLQ